MAEPKRGDRWDVRAFADDEPAHPARRRWRLRAWALHAMSAADLLDRTAPVTSEDFARIAQVLFQQNGVRVSEGNPATAYARIAKRLRLLGMENFREYCELISGAAGVDERQAVVAELTTDVARFFREPHHFDHLRDHVLPGHIDRVRRGGRLRLWSAACAMGHEPYALAMTLFSVMPDAAARDVKILATDIDPNVLRSAREGYYADADVEAVPEELRTTWLERDADGWRVKDALRAVIAFRELSLTSDWPIRTPLDVIFCRNVMIYFDEVMQQRLWARVAAKLVTDGALYIGEVERVSGSAAALFMPDGTSIYRKRASA